MYFGIYFTNRLTDFGPLCIKDSARASQRKQSSSIRKTSQLILYRQVTAVFKQSYGTQIKCVGNT
jgi:hypothetical protein